MVPRLSNHPYLADHPPDGLSEGEEDRGRRNRAGRDGRKVDPGTASLRRKKKTGAYILSVYKRDGKANEEGEGRNAARAGAICRVIYEYCLRRKVYRYRATTSTISLSFSLSLFLFLSSLFPLRRLRNDSCVAVPLVYIRVVSEKRTIALDN